MRILITGATGFIGGAAVAALRRRGHAVVAVSRQPVPGGLQADLADRPSRDWWAPRLAGVDAVLNAVGILREQGAQTFDALHATGPAELFHACAMAGVSRVVQVSALGADATATSRYHRSKKAADDVLRALPVGSTILQPSLVYGPGGSSTALFNQLASLPVLAFPLRGGMRVQPVHVDDLVEAIVATLEAPARPGCETVACTGPRAMPLREYLQVLRRQLGWRGSQLVVPLPVAWFRFAASIAGHVPGSMLDRETADMLLAGNAADDPVFAARLQRPPRDPTGFVPQGEAGAMRREAVLATGLPLLRLAVAGVWIWTGIVSLGLYPVAHSYDLLARVGVTGSLAPPALYGAAVLDLALGVLTLAAPAGWRRWTWATQLVLIGVYTVLISLFLPEYWLHPYGPLSKNLPMMAAIALLWALEPPPRARS
jgi:uncharacterized protein YbjT (DUF2867 family)